MATWMPERDTVGYTHMGGEGRDVDRHQAPFTEPSTCSRTSATAPTRTPASSRFAPPVAAGVNMTYKILFNGAVAMTGGQTSRAASTVRRRRASCSRPRVCGRHRRDRRAPSSIAGGARRRASRAPPARARAVQRELREVPGVTALIYDQTCAAELRRKRKRGDVDDPDKRVVINELVCEGCGDCNVQSNCISVSRSRPNSGASAVSTSVLQQGLQLREGFLPELRDGEGRRMRNPQPRPLAAEVAAGPPSRPQSTIVHDVQRS